ncbi:BTB domain-containing protein [Mycena venus]|uniref:BTB domain-containing protein n=1 Tax=Mycena venus TaxID=2733690 RepID=A0A8H7DFH1_9AGAR|nr:BTB domain-containing protein [Mycena venus]
MWFRLLSLLTLSTLVFAQGDDTVSVSTGSQVFDASAAFTFLWKGEAGHNLNNITLELIEGSAEDNGNNVIDIMATNVSSVDSTQIDYTVHPGVPGGTYHARMNGTIYNGDTVLSAMSKLSTLSNTFSIPDSGVPCSAGTFTPITGLNDPAYHPLRFTTPLGGHVITLAEITGPFASLSIQLGLIDVLFGELDGISTVEVINSETGFNAGVQHAHLAFPEYITSNITLDPGSWKVRMNFTIFAPANYPGAFSLESEEFFIVADSSSKPNCTTSSSSSASASGAGSGTVPAQSNPASTPSGSVPHQSNQPSAPATSGADPSQSSTAPSSSNNAAVFTRDRKNIIQSGFMCAFIWAVVSITVGQL